MIISMYQGVGKSTLSKNDLKYIDFESSCFDKSSDNWYLDYCRAALNLEKQGYTVFIASHDAVVNYLKRFGLEYYVIMPDITIKDEWIEKLKARYERTDSDKDFRALRAAELYFDNHYQNMLKMQSEGLHVYFIKDINYNLEDIIISLKEAK